MTLVGGVKKGLILFWGKWGGMEMGLIQRVARHGRCEMK